MKRCKTSGYLNRTVLLAAALLGALPLIVPAITINVPQDQPGIQAAINVAQDGDIISVSPGTYFENINFLGKAIKVRSKKGASETIIDGGSSDSVVTFTSGETLKSTLTGFTIRNGRSDPDTPGSGEGGGISIDNSSPTIKNNIIENNVACAGDGISVSFGSALIQGNIIRNNSQAACSGGIGGGGIVIRGAAKARILDNVITNNSPGADGGGISLFAAGAPVIRGNTIEGNTAGEGGGIAMVNQSDALIVQNVIASNSAGTGGGIYWLVPSDDRGPFVINNTITRNSSTNGSAIFADGFDARSLLVNNIIVASSGEVALFCGDFNDTSVPRIRFNDVFSASGAAYGGTCADQTGIQGNISASPLFVSASKGDYHIKKGSPALDAGDNTAPNLSATDFDGDPRIQDGNLDGTAVIDMGVDEFTPSAAGQQPSESTAKADSLARDTVGSARAPLLNLRSTTTNLIRASIPDNHITVSTYDAAGRLIIQTDANGVRRFAP